VVEEYLWSEVFDVPLGAEEVIKDDLIFENRFIDEKRSDRRFPCISCW